MLDGNAADQNTRQENRVTLYRKLNGGIGEKLNDWNRMGDTCLGWLLSCSLLTRHDRRNRRESDVRGYPPANYWGCRGYGRSQVVFDCKRYLTLSAHQSCKLPGSMCLGKLCCHLSQCNLIFHLISQIYYGFWFQNTLESSYRVSIFNDLELMQFCKRHDLFPNRGAILP